MCSRIALVGQRTTRLGDRPKVQLRQRDERIKPSFLWMMYRCGWATEPGQERVLAVEITRVGFEWALAHACLSHPFPPHLAVAINAST